MSLVDITEEIYSVARYKDWYRTVMSNHEVFSCPAYVMTFMYKDDNPTILCQIPSMLNHRSSVILIQYNQELKVIETYYKNVGIDSMPKIFVDEDEELIQLFKNYCVAMVNRKSTDLWGQSSVIRDKNGFGWYHRQRYTGKIEDVLLLPEIPSQLMKEIDDFAVGLPLTKSSRRVRHILLNPNTFEQAICHFTDRRLIGAEIVDYQGAAIYGKRYEN